MTLKSHDTESSPGLGVISFVSASHFSTLGSATVAGVVAAGGGNAGGTVRGGDDGVAAGFGNAGDTMRAGDAWGAAGEGEAGDAAGSGSNARAGSMAVRRSPPKASEGEQGVFMPMVSFPNRGISGPLETAQAAPAKLRGRKMPRDGDWGISSHKSN